MAEHMGQSLGQAVVVENKPSAGSTQHLAAELFKTVTGIDALLVPYKGSPAVLTALRASEIDLAFEIAGPMVSQVSAGAVKALAVSSGQRNPALERGDPGGKDRTGVTADGCAQRLGHGR